MGVPPTFYCLVKQSHADVVKLVYTPDLGSGALRRGGSSPLIRTIYLYINFKTSNQRIILKFIV